MRLVISKDTVQDIQFLKFLIDYIKVYLMEHIDQNKEKAWNQYFSLSNDLSGATLRQVVGESLKYITVTEYQQSFEITIKTEEKLRGTNAKLYEVCKLINYGNLSIIGYPIYTDTFRYFEKHLSDYMDKYNGVERKAE